MTLVLLGAVLLLSLLPSLCFLGFWHGLVRMRRGSLVTRVTGRAGSDDPTVTWGDVFDAYADPQKRLFSSSPGPQSPCSREDRCSVCAAENDAFASFCQGCLRKLE